MQYVKQRNVIKVIIFGHQNPGHLIFYAMQRSLLFTIFLVLFAQLK